MATLIALGLLWVGVTAWMARSELNAVRAAAPVLRAQLLAADIPAATASADLMARQASRSHKLTGGPAWALISRIPVLGEPFETARGITGVADELGRNALPQLVEAGTAIDPGPVARRRTAGSTSRPCARSRPSSMRPPPRSPGPSARPSSCRTRRISAPSTAPGSTCSPSCVR